MRRAFALMFSLSAMPIAAADLDTIVQDDLLPRYQTLADQSAALSTAAKQDCAPDGAGLRDSFGAAFDAWVQVSHLRFGPSEANDRAFALAFWPDSRGATPKALAQLIRDEDPIIDTPSGVADLSIAARGFYALEFLLYDLAFTEMPTAYSCALIRALSADVAANAAAILQDWEAGYADLFVDAENDVYRSRQEAEAQLFTALTTGLEFTSGMRLGRPLGTPDRPRPRRAEAWRSERSQRHVLLSLGATESLAVSLAAGDPAMTDDLQRAFDRAVARVQSFDDPTFAGVADPVSRFRIEALKQQIDDLRAQLATELGPRLGVTAGFNSLDGD